MSDDTRTESRTDSETESRTDSSTTGTTPWVPPPWEPPVDGTEAAHLVGALDRQRATVRWKTDGLDEVGLRHRLPSSALSLGGLLLHLAMVEDYYLTTKLRGEVLEEPWRSLGHDGTDEWEFTTELTAEQTCAVFDEAVVRNTARIEAALAEGGLDLVAHVDDGEGHHPRLRRLLLDLLEEYARHAGHADLLREAVDGRVGEDPPADWVPAWLA